MGAVLLRHEIGSIFDNLSTIYEDSKWLWSENLTNVIIPPPQRIIIFFAHPLVSNSGQDAGSFQFLTHANNTSEWMWKMFSKNLAAGAVMIFTVAPLISAFLNWVTNKNVKVLNLYHPIPHVYVRIQSSKMSCQFVLSQHNQ